MGSSYGIGDGSGGFWGGEAALRSETLRATSSPQWDTEFFLAGRDALRLVFGGAPLLVAVFDGHPTAAGGRRRLLGRGVVDVAKLGIATQPTEVIQNEVALVPPEEWPRHASSDLGQRCKPSSPKASKFHASRV